MHADEKLRMILEKNRDRMSRNKTDVGEMTTAEIDENEKEGGPWRRWRCYFSYSTTK